MNDYQAIMLSGEEKITSDDSNDSNSDSFVNNNKASENNSETLAFIESDFGELMCDISKGSVNYCVDKGQEGDEKEDRKTYSVDIMRKSFLSSRFAPEFIDSNKITNV